MGLAMASIKILARPTNRKMAGRLAELEGITRLEDGGWITVTREGELRIPRPIFLGVYDPTGSRAARQDPRLEQQWRQLAIAETGYLVSVSDEEIVISDDDPDSETRPQFHFRFRDNAQLEETRRLAKLTGRRSITEYVQAAIDAANQAMTEDATTPSP